MGDTSDQIVFWVVVSGRLLIPLLIFKYPLPAIIGCLVLDGVDQTIFQQWTSLDLTNYQNYDKALDVYYLSIAYIATMRNWTSAPAFAIAQFLYFYRLVGSTIFELTGGDQRWLLLVFPNTFEYFFIFYELVRSRWNPATLSHRFWLLSAAAIWVCIKLPQEYWIHVAQLDTTDLIQEQPWVGYLMIAVVAALAAGFWFGVWPRLRPADHPFELAAGPLPAKMDSARDRVAFRVARGTVFDLWLLEKIVIVTLVSLIFAQIIPGVSASTLDIAVSCAVVIIVNSFIGLLTARRGRGIESVVRTFFALTAINLVFIYVTSQLQTGESRFFLTAGFFFVFLLTLIVVVYDRYRPVLDVRLGAHPVERLRV